MKHIMKCEICTLYTLKESCQQCEQKTVKCGPAKFSPQDAYGKYRRQAKSEGLRRSGLI